MPQSNVLGQAQSLIEKRIKELEAERAKLERALSDLGGSVRRGPGRPRGSKTKRRRRRGGTRREQALKLISDNPEITVGQIAEKMKIAPNYVYRVMNDLKKERLVRKKGKGWVAS
jgi:hypothetical protein